MYVYAYSLLFFFLFFFSGSGDHRDLHSFPHDALPILVIGDLVAHEAQVADPDLVFVNDVDPDQAAVTRRRVLADLADQEDRKSTRLNSSHLGISYAVFCLKKKTTKNQNETSNRVAQQT